MVASFEYIDQRIEYFQKATEVNLQTPGRKGGVVQLGPETADDVLIAGDLHGHRRNFLSLSKAADLANNPRRHLVLQEVCHGGPTYPSNGGDMSHGLLEEVAKLMTLFPGRVHFLLGNHELSELTEYPIQKNNQMLNLLFQLGLQQMYGPASVKIREAFSPFLMSCPLAVRVGEDVFAAHSIPEEVDRRGFDPSFLKRRLEPAEFFERKGLFDLVWGRDYRQENADAFASLVGAEILITGHDPCPKGFGVPNNRQLIVDCCDDLACYVLLPAGETHSMRDVLERVKRLR